MKSAQCKLLIDKYNKTLKGFLFQLQMTQNYFAIRKVKTTEDHLAKWNSQLHKDQNRVMVYKYLCSLGK